MFKFTSKYDIKDYVLVVPCVSVGNVGQLAADLLISSLKMEKIACAWSPAIIPVIGGDPYDLTSKSLMLSCELFANDTKKLCVLQLRSPLVKKYAKEFLRDLVQFAKENQVRSLIVLTSSFASERHTISTAPYRYFSNKLIESDEKTFEELQWVSHDVQQNNTKVHGGGFANRIFEFATEQNLPCTVLFKYCSEGDNIPDAVEMSAYLNDWMKFFDVSSNVLQQFVQPPSWKLLYGNPPPRDIY